VCCIIDYISSAVRRVLMYEIISVLTMLLSSYAFVRLLGTEGKAEFLLVFFCVATAQIVFCGYVLSSFGHLGNALSWSALGTAFVFAGSAVIVIKKPAWARSFPRVDLRSLGRPALAIKKWYVEETSTFEKLLLTPLVLVTASVGVLNLALVVSAAPHNFDSMTHHLARMAYYLQQNSLDYYPANYWAQVAKMKNSTILFLYSYLMSGRNENLTQLVQFISYWVAVCSVYGIARRIGNSKTHSLFAALVSALLVEWLLESSTTQDDMIVTAYFGSAIYFLFAYRGTGLKKYLALAALAVGLSFGTSAKASLSMPPLFLVGCYSLFSRETFRNGLKQLAYLAAALCLAVSLFALPAGYIENYRNFGNPLGPDVGSEQMKDITFTGKPIDYIAENGTKNLLRFGFQFLALDGLPPVGIVQGAQEIVMAVPRYIVDGLGIDLESSKAVLVPFQYKKAAIFFSNEDWSSWGVFGFSLIWLVVFLSAIGVFRAGDMRVLSYATILFTLAVAYTLPYEPHYTRYFVTCAVFAVPTVGAVLRSKRKFIRAYLLLVVLAGCISALSAVVLRPARPLVAMKDLSENCPVIRQFEFLPVSVFEMDRVAQMTTNAWGLYPPIRAFDGLVPEDATVAVFLPGGKYEYPLFGEHLTRRIVPINPFVGGFKAIPENSDYLLYAEGFPAASPDDVDLGEGWHLRQLSGDGTQAIEQLKAAVRSHPENASYHNRLGIAYGQKGLFDEAIEEFKTAIRLAPAEPSYRSNLDKATLMKNSSGKPNRGHAP
jgi:4-amino-4-deoxy-L-arabinose transferase-like glycosyltransferase